MLNNQIVQIWEDGFFQCFVDGMLAVASESCVYLLSKNKNGKVFIISFQKAKTVMLCLM